VKEKCGIAVTDYDTTIDNLIAEQLPAIEYSVRPEHISDGNAGLQATLNLAAAEIVCGEFLAQLGRTPGYLDRLRLGDLEIWPARSGLTESGWSRLHPFLKEDSGTYVLGRVVSQASPTEDE
jgi:hypothetical protein